MVTEYNNVTVNKEGNLKKGLQTYFREVSYLRNMTVRLHI